MFAPRKKNGGPVCEVNDVMWSQNEAAHNYLQYQLRKYVPGARVPGSILLPLLLLPLR